MISYSRKDPRIGGRGVLAGSVCDECIALAMDEKQNEADGGPQPASLRSSAGMAA